MNEVQNTINNIIRTHGELIESLQAERDELIERLDRVKAERDEARRCAVQMRDLYAAEVDESIEAFPWPWEVNDE